MTKIRAKIRNLVIQSLSTNYQLFSRKQNQNQNTHKYKCMSAIKQYINKGKFVRKQRTTNFKRLFRGYAGLYLTKIKLSPTNTTK